MHTGSFPVASIYATWFETVEVTSADDDKHYDMSDLTDIILKLIDPLTDFEWLGAKKSTGEITMPAVGIIQWSIKADRMRTLDCKNYQMLLLLEKNPDESMVLALGPMSVVR